MMLFMAYLPMQAAMSEKLCDFFIDDPKSSGIPDQRLINLYEKFGNGEFGMIITGNVMVDHVSAFYAQYFVP
jgi:hypothetical protein